jgi:2-oxo-4-hydroxy-4-carboxy-5-ureidoimidazoline decarboxylase
MTVAEINAMDRASFVAKVGWVFEHSPWVAERAWPERPFADLKSMHGAMSRQVREASREEQLSLLRAHPDLGARARMSDASAGEQSGAGLDRLTAEEFDRLTAANAAYRDTFGFPFLFAVKGSTKHGILAAIESRIGRAWEEEFETALTQVFRIAGFRLQEIVET